MTTKKKMSKSERTLREDALTDVMFYALGTPTEEYALAWQKRALALMEGMPQSSIKRAKRRALAMAETLAPGYLKAMEARGVFDDIMKRRDITKRDEDAIWGAVAQFCMYQLAARKGPFYEAARDFHLAPGNRAAPLDLGNVRVEVIRLQPPTGPDGCGNPDCPNCRPRTAEELN